MTPEDAPAPPSAARRVEAFRGQRPRAPLHPAEKALLWILGANLCFLPWALGAMHPPAEIVSLILAAAGFAAAMRPRVVARPGGEGTIRLVPWIKLRRFPIFWIGLALLALVAVQGLNPDWRFVETTRFWWLVAHKNVAWLPAGIEAPFGRFNVWRDFVIGASAWLTVCSVWVGLMRKKSLRILLGVLAGNGVLLGLLGAYQHITGDSRTPWPLTAMTGYPLNSSFIYKNHAGAYFALMTFVAVALATWFFDLGTRTMQKSTPAGILGLAALFMAGTVLFTLSKGASLILAASLLIFAVWFLVRRKVRGVAEGSNTAVTAVVVVVFALFALNTIRYVDFSQIYQRFDQLAVEGREDVSVSARILVHEADSDMLRAHWLRGVGAGGFRYLFPKYLGRYPAIFQGGQVTWEHAHGDWWEVPIELGLAGDLLLLGGAAWWAWWFVRHRVGWHAFSVPLLLGCAQTVIHAGFDFPFQCPAILITWCVLVAVAAKGVED